MPQSARVTMDSIQENFDSKFRFVLLAAQRSEQLIQGANPRVEMKTPKRARIAMQELLEQKIDWGYGPAPERGGDEGEASE